MSEVEKVRVVVEISGGAVQAVYANQPAEVVVVDFDATEEDNLNVQIGKDRGEGFHMQAQIDQDHVENVFVQLTDTTYSDSGDLVTD